MLLLLGKSIKANVISTIVAPPKIAHMGVLDATAGASDAVGLAEKNPLRHATISIPKGLGAFGGA
jgi:hypothetical protein